MTKEPDGGEQKGLLIFLSPGALLKLDEDATRCRRARIRQIEAILLAYLGLENVDIGDMTAVREAVRAGKVSAFEPTDTRAPLGRTVNEVENQQPATPEESAQAHPKPPQRGRGGKK
jgi:hypothetical protein